MEPLSSRNNNFTLTMQEKKVLLRMARHAIQYGLRENRILPFSIEEYPESLKKPMATFVTLETGGELRGCIGSLEAHAPLISDVVHNAFAAAFRDPRFNSITKEELPRLHISISILSTPELLSVHSEQELIEQIRPGVDGLIFEDHGQRGTFLPSVWEQLPDPRQFIHYLKRKAGFSEDYWSSTLKTYRYQTEIIEEKMVS